MNICPVCRVNTDEGLHINGCPFEGDNTLGGYLKEMMKCGGWKCPVCNRIYSPVVQECAHCNKNCDAGHRAQ